MKLCITIGMVSWTELHNDENSITYLFLKAPLQNPVPISSPEMFHLWRLQTVQPVQDTLRIQSTHIQSLFIIMIWLFIFNPHVSIKTTDRLKYRPCCTTNFFIVSKNVFVVYKSNKDDKKFFFRKITFQTFHIVPELQHKWNKMPLSKVNGIAPLKPILTLFFW